LLSDQQRIAVQCFFKWLLKQHKSDSTADDLSFCVCFCQILQSSILRCVIRKSKRWTRNKSYDRHSVDAVDERERRNHELAFKRNRTAEGQQHPHLFYYYFKFTNCLTNLLDCYRYLTRRLCAEIGILWSIRFVPFSLLKKTKLKSILS